MSILELKNCVNGDQHNGFSINSNPNLLGGGIYKIKDQTLKLRIISPRGRIFNLMEHVITKIRLKPQFFEQIECKNQSPGFQIKIQKVTMEHMDSLLICGRNFLVQVWTSWGAAFLLKLDLDLTSPEPLRRIKAARSYECLIGADAVQNQQYQFVFTALCHVCPDFSSQVTPLEPLFRSRLYSRSGFCM